MRLLFYDTISCRKSQEEQGENASIFALFLEDRQPENGKIDQARLNMRRLFGNDQPHGGRPCRRQLEQRGSMWLSLRESEQPRLEYEREHWLPPFLFSCNQFMPQLYPRRLTKITPLGQLLVA